MDVGVPMNIVFVGSTSFGLKCLQACLQLNYVNVVGIVTAPQRFAISYSPEGVDNVLYEDIHTFASSKGIPAVQLIDTMHNAELIANIKNWNPHAFLVAGWYHILPKSWRTIAPAYGLHASLLPDYSGGAPLVWSIINGESRTGVTLFQMDDGVDSGPIVAQAVEPILTNDTISSLYSRIEAQGVQLLKRSLPQLARGIANLQPQDETKRRIFPQRCPDDGRIDWTWSASKIYNFVRAQTLPYPGAFTHYGPSRIYIWSSLVTSCPQPLPPGFFLEANNSIVVCCGDGSALRLNTVGESNTIVDAYEWWKSTNNKYSNAFTN
jgi:methionyl-tRNA formyltransferase